MAVKIHDSQKFQINRIFGKIGSGEIINRNDYNNIGRNLE
jgi:hypothetical protein